MVLNRSDTQKTVRRIFKRGLCCIKICTRCGIEKDESEFYRDYRYGEGHYKSICKSCWSERKKQYRLTHAVEISESSKRYYREHKDEINRRTSKWQQDNRERITEQQRIKRQPFKEKLFSLKTPCVKCGEDRLLVIQFHHINPQDKLFQINQNAVKKRSEEEIETELKKCVCLCSNCHFEFHNIYGAKPKHPVEDLKEYLGR